VYYIIFRDCPCIYWQALRPWLLLVLHPVYRLDKGVLIFLLETAPPYIDILHAHSYYLCYTLSIHLTKVCYIILFILTYSTPVATTRVIHCPLTRQRWGPALIFWIDHFKMEFCSPSTQIQSSIIVHWRALCPWLLLVLHIVHWLGKVVLLLVFSGCLNQEIGQPSLFKGHIIGTHLTRPLRILKYPAPLATIRATPFPST
jgi:hypothetical protein